VVDSASQREITQWISIKIAKPPSVSWRFCLGERNYLPLLQESETFLTFETLNIYELLDPLVAPVPCVPVPRALVGESLFVELVAPAEDPALTIST